LPADQDRLPDTEAIRAEIGRLYGALH
jgi:hypothetical protein